MRYAPLISLLGTGVLVVGVGAATIGNTWLKAETSEPSYTSRPDESSPQISAPETSPRIANGEAPSTSSEMAEVRSVQQETLTNVDEKAKRREASEDLQTRIHEFTVTVTHDFYKRLEASGIKLEDARTLAGTSPDGLVTTEVLSAESSGHFVVAREYEMFTGTKLAFVNVLGYGRVGLTVYFHAPNWQEVDDALQDICKSNNMTPDCECDFSAIESHLSIPCSSALGDTDGSVRRRLASLLEADLASALRTTSTSTR